MSDLFQDFDLISREQYDELNACCISQYVQRVVDASAILTNELPRNVEADGFIPGLNPGLRLNLLEKLASVGVCAECSSRKIRNHLLR